MSPNKKPPKLTANQQVILDLYDAFHRPAYLEWDPLSIIRSNVNPKDWEWVGLLAALFAFGGVIQIKAALQEALRRVGQRPFETEGLATRLEGFKHRIYVGADVAALLVLIQKSRQKFGSIQGHFEHHHSPKSETVEQALSGVIADYRAWVGQLALTTGPHFDHLLNSPQDGGACKRWLMYLKWMIRPDDGIDLGVWQSSTLRPHQLVIPLDVHLFRISRRLKLCKLRSANWKSALEVTRSLRKLDASDPTRFDFSLCRYGMLRVRNRLPDSRLVRRNK